MDHLKITVVTENPLGFTFPGHEEMYGTVLVMVRRQNDPAFIQDAG
ncbi:hypothetical protein [Endozoicomonas acroporae]|nr:hypothetical protein [Endozoicomonas acroporae]